MILKAGGRLGMGGDYGFAWNPHGDYAKELTFFVKHVGFTPLETITCATKTGAEIMGRGHEFGTVEPGKLADILIVDGDVLADIAILEDRSRFLAVMQGGVIKAGRLAAGAMARTCPEARSTVLPNRAMSALPGGVLCRWRNHEGRDAADRSRYGLPGAGIHSVLDAGCRNPRRRAVTG